MIEFILSLEQLHLGYINQSLRDVFTKRYSVLQVSEPFNEMLQNKAEEVSLPYKVNSRTVSTDLLFLMILPPFCIFCW